MSKTLRLCLLWLLLLALAASLPWLLDALRLGYVTSIVTRGLILALAGLSLNLVLGFGGMVSFGHAAFFGLGGYVVAILARHAESGEAIVLLGLHLPGTYEALLAWPLAMAVAGLAALVIGALSLRTSGLYFIMITLAFAQMLFFFFVSFKTYGGDDGLPLRHRSLFAGLDLDERTHFFYLVVVLVLLAHLGKAWLLRSNFGTALKAIRDNEARMRALGYQTYRIKLTAFTLSGAFTGLAGVLMANQIEFVSPSFMTWHQSGEFLVVVILGGMGALLGPLLGAGIYLGLEEILSQWTLHWQIILGPVLIVIVLFAKGGLVELVSRVAALKDRGPWRRR